MEALFVLDIANELDGDGRSLVVLQSAIGSEDESYGESFRALRRRARRRPERRGATALTRIGEGPADFSLKS